MVKDRPSAAALRRRSVSSGMNRPIASSTNRSSWARRTRCATGATWRSTNPAASGESRIVARAIRRAFHATRSPAADPGPHLREPVPQLDGLAEVGLAGLGRQTDGGRELRDTELRHQRRTRPGHGDPGVAVAPVPDGGGLVDRVDRVHAHPRHRGLQQLGLGPVRERTSIAHETQHRSSRICLGAGLADGLGHGSIQAVTTDTFRCPDRPVEAAHRTVRCGPTPAPRGCTHSPAGGTSRRLGHVVRALHAGSATRPGHFTPTRIGDCGKRTVGAQSALASRTACASLSLPSAGRTSRESSRRPAAPSSSETWSAV